MSEVLSQTRTMHRQKESGLDRNLPAEPADDLPDISDHSCANNAARDLPADLRSQINPFRS